MYAVEENSSKNKMARMEYWNKKLHKAAENGDIEALKLCLQNDADVDYQSKFGYTALMLTAGEGHLEVARLLLDSRCQIETTDDGGFTAFMWASERGQMEISRLIHDSGCETNTTDINGRTALHLAAEEGHLMMTIYLVEKACISPFVQTHKGETPYDLAAALEEGQYKEVMKYLQIVMSRDVGPKPTGRIQETQINNGSTY